MSARLKVELRVAQQFAVADSDTEVFDYNLSFVNTP